MSSDPSQASNWVERVITFADKTFKPDFMFQDLSPILVDMGIIGPNVVCAEGNHPVLQVISRLYEIDIPAIPVTECTRNIPYQEAVIGAFQLSGICALRIHGQAMKGESWRSDILRTVADLGIKPEKIILIIDWGHLNYLPRDLSSYTERLYRIADLGNWQTIVSTGSSAPKSLSQFNPGLSILGRVEWTIQLELDSRKDKLGREIAFGDGTTRPPTLGGRIIRRRGAPSLCFTANSAFIFIKSPKLWKDNPSKHFQDITRKLVSLDEFEGTDYCFGNQVISQVAKGIIQIRGKQKLIFATENHHLIKVANDMRELAS